MGVTERIIQIVLTPHKTHIPSRWTTFGIQQKAHGILSMETCPVTRPRTTTQAPDFIGLTHRAWVPRHRRFLTALSRVLVILQRTSYRILSRSPSSHISFSDLFRLSVFFARLHTRSLPISTFFAITKDLFFSFRFPCLLRQSMLFYSPIDGVWYTK